MRLLGLAVVLSISAFVACSQGPKELPSTAQDIQTGATPSAVAQMNDLSILFPLATTQADFDAYLPASAQGVGGPLVPQDLFTPFNTPIKTAVGTAAAELAYASLRVVAIRLDPCFAQIGPITDSTPCLNQLRVIFQSLSFANGVTTAEDSGLHVFYSLTRDEFSAAVQAVIALRNANSDGTDEGPLAVHPILAAQGVSGAMAAGLAAIVQQYGGTGTITRMTRLISTNDFWDFDGIDIANAASTPMVIPTLPSPATLARFTSPFPTNNLNGSFSPSTTSSDNMELLAEITNAQHATVAAQQSALDAAHRIENPNFHSPNTIDCASCHLAEIARLLNGPTLGLSATGNPNAFVAPASIPLADVAVTAAPGPGALSRNFHAFSYRGTQPVIAQRVINETASIVAYVNANLLVPSPDAGPADPDGGPADPDGGPSAPDAPAAPPATSAQCVASGGTCIPLGPAGSSCSDSGGSVVEGACSDTVTGIGGRPNCCLPAAP